jgi:choline dehydrogenase-like flavoprotein
VIVAASEEAYDYVIVGAGAGGGTLAARLTEAGMNVFLIEAGRDLCIASDPLAGFPSH